MRGGKLCRRCAGIPNSRRKTYGGKAVLAVRLVDFLEFLDGRTVDAPGISLGQEAFMDKPQNNDAPGLAWRERRNGWGRGYGC